MYWLARLLEGGDLKSVCRRILACVYEDCSLANPDLGVRAVAAVAAAQQLGYPEARIPLANIVIDICLSPKSDSTIMAIDSALADVKSGYLGEIPFHLRDAHYASAQKLGHGVGYKYPHAYPNSWVNQQYLPDDLVGRTYYEPKGHGQEKHYKSVYERLESLKQKPTQE